MDLHPIVDAVAAETVSAVYGYGIDYSLPADHALELIYLVGRRAKLSV